MLWGSLPTAVMVQHSIKAAEDGALLQTLFVNALVDYIFSFRYAMERTNDYISVWFWSRYDPYSPFFVTCDALIIDTTQWVTVPEHLVDCGSYII